MYCILSDMSGVSNSSHFMDKHYFSCFVLMAFKLPRFRDLSFSPIFINMGYIELKLFWAILWGSTVAPFVINVGPCVHFLDGDYNSKY